MIFSSPQFVWFLLFIPLVIVIFVYSYYKKKSALLKIGHIDIIKKLVNNISGVKRILKKIILIIVIFLITLVLMRPQWGIKSKKLSRKGINIVFVVDVSKSMLAQDIKPNRLEKAKYEISTFLDKLNGDRVGLVAFAGSAFISCPLTLDYNAIKMFIDILDPSMIQRQGTKLENAIRTAMKLFDQSEKKYKAIILLTDGESHGDNPLDAAKDAKLQGIRIYTIGLGKITGEPIPIEDEKGNFIGYKKDRNGNLVVSKLDELTLQKISLETGGKFIYSRYGGLELDNIYKDINKMDKKNLKSSQIIQREDRFQYFIIIILILLVLEMIITERKSEKNIEWKGRYE